MGGHPPHPPSKKGNKATTVTQFCQFKILSLTHKICSANIVTNRFLAFYVTTPNMPNIFIIIRIFIIKKINYVQKKN